MQVFSLEVACCEKTTTKACRERIIPQSIIMIHFRRLIFVDRTVFFISRPLSHFTEKAETSSCVFWLFAGLPRGHLSSGLYSNKKVPWDNQIVKKSINISYPIQAGVTFCAVTCF